jgi:hypothetical protein
MVSPSQDRLNYINPNIQNSLEVPAAIQGTYNEALRNIVRTGGLNRMARQCIQMAVGMPNDPEVHSGIWPLAEIIIYIDVDRAMSQGLWFYRLENYVICCPEPIPFDCFIVVVRWDGSVVDLNLIWNNYYVLCRVEKQRICPHLPLEGCGYCYLGLVWNAWCECYSQEGRIFDVVFCCV